MGLDMYIERRLKTQTKEQMEKESDAEWKKGIGNWREKFKSKHELAYWRKVNWLHGYIVDTFAAGIDKCQEIALSKENVKKVLERVNYACKILDDAELVEQERGETINYRETYHDKPNGERKRLVRAENGEIDWKKYDGKYWKLDAHTAEEVSEVFKTRDGFFFGSQDYDIWYAYDMFNTKEKLEKILDGWDDEYTVYYQASW